MRFFRNAKDVSNGGMSIDDMKVRWKDNPKTLKVYLSAAEVLEDFIKNHKEHFKTSDPNVVTTLNVECLYKTTNIIPYLTNGVYIHNFWVWRIELWLKLIQYITALAKKQRKRCLPHS